MLDNETKRRIDTCRDILVGKVPDPKSQVEQISIALIYKFMDDMDREAVEMGGKPGFFTGDYTKYAWSKIFDPRLGGFDMLALYSEAITRMSQNPGIPQLFRDIFKNAYLPYRDPETLKLFLKSINDFNYDHSERLGDAFEYLLSVLGSQGDAGQFRTPRHIIDFMIEVVKPQKHETILDPACGTAGFLISSYKHIIKANTKKMPGDQLKTEERKKLLTNFKGYDISPDMVRLSLVNLYLHGFVQPQVMEYDTLTSEDRWNEYADVILANPPFMSPKGGIKPHKRFSVQSNRSEVLFVDYIAEHLTPTGRAAVIVPEGIIFQSANAYKQLRKYLVDEGYLYAVVSLPAGVFNPYSGVKTSILLMDRTIAKKAESVLFIKVDNDGFDLGAQRRSHDKNDLPGALELLNQYVDSVRAGKAFDADALNGNAILVAKEKLAENGEYNLTGERHRVTEKRVHQKWPMVKLGDVCEVRSGWGFPLDKQGSITGRYPFYKVSDMNLSGNERLMMVANNYIDEVVVKELGCVPAPSGTVIFPKIGAAIATNKKRILTKDSCYDNNLMGIIPSNKINYYYLYLIFQFIDISIFASTAQPPSIRKTTVEDYVFPLPPLDIQREIVAEIEGYQKIIDGARQVVDNWKPQIDIDPEWPIAKLGDTSLFAIESGGTPDSANELYWNGDIYWATLVDLPASDYISMIKDTTRKITEKGLNNSSAKIVPIDSIIVSTRATIGRVGINKIPLSTNQGFKNIIIKDIDKVLPLFLAFMIKRLAPDMERLATGGTFKEISKTSVSNLEIPLPPLNIQQSIIDKIEYEGTFVDGCRDLLQIYEDKIKQVIDKVWED